MPAKISALISTYASADFLPEALEDLANQPNVDQLEVVVVDAASPEDEARVVRKLKAAFPRLAYYRTQRRISIYAAWNVAIGLARGQYMLSVSANDRLAPDACQVLAQALDDNPEAALAYGDSHLTDLPHQRFDDFAPSSKPGGPRMEWPPFLREELVSCCLVGPHAMWRKSAHASVGMFDPTYLRVGDQDFWLRLAARFPLVHVNRVTGLHWLADNQLSGGDQAEDEVRRLRKVHLAAFVRERALATYPVEAETVLDLLARDQVLDGLDAYQTLLFPQLLLERFEAEAQRIQVLAARGRPHVAAAALEHVRATYERFPELCGALDGLAPAFAA